MFLALDGDEAGRKASLKVAERLAQEGLHIVPVDLPEGKDPADMVQQGGARAFKALLRKAAGDVALRPSMPFHPARHGYSATREGFCVTFGGERSYEVRGIARSPGRLRLTIRASKEGKFHLDGLDLYSSRARQTFARVCKDQLGMALALVEEDLFRVLEYAESFEPREVAQGQEKGTSSSTWP